MKQLAATILAGSVLISATLAQAQGPPPPPPPPPPAPISGAVVFPGGNPDDGKPLTGTGLILGRVVDGSGNRPVPGAIVMLSRAPSPPSGNSPTGTFPPQRVVTDNTGRFVFHDLPAGRFDFSVNAPGYRSPGGYGAQRPDGQGRSLELAEAGKARDVVLRVWRAGTITGTVLDALGEPVIGIQVRALQVQFIGGRRRFVQVGSFQTDDRGMYRLSSIPAGEYVVGIPSTLTTLPQSSIDEYQRATSSGAGPVALLNSSSGAPIPSPSGGYRVGDYLLSMMSNTGRSIPIPPPDDAGRMMIYPAVYFPNAATVAEAQVVRLESGQERSGVDLQPRLVPAFRVSGQVIGPAGPVASIGVRLIPGGSEELTTEGGFESGITLTTSRGEFTLLGIPAGQYTLKVIQVPRPNPMNSMTSVMVETASGGMMSMGTSLGPGGPPAPPPIPNDPTLWAITPVTIGDTDVTGVTLNLQSGPRMSGRIVFEGSREKPSNDQIIRAPITLEPADGRSTAFFADARGQIDANLQFRTTGIVPGKYLLRVGGGFAGWTLKSAELNGRDISDQPIAIETSDIAGVTITFTDHPVELSGVVRDTSGAADLSASVVIFPADRSRWSENGRNPRSERLTRPSTTGTYTFTGLPPGEYLIAAVDDAQLTQSWSDPRFLDVLARVALRITLDENGNKSQDLRRVALR